MGRQSAWNGAFSGKPWSRGTSFQKNVQWGWPHSTVGSSKNTAQRVVYMSTYNPKIRLLFQKPCSTKALEPYTFHKLTTSPPIPIGLSDRRWTCCSYTRGTPWSICFEISLFRGKGLHLWPYWVNRRRPCRCVLSLHMARMLPRPRIRQISSFSHWFLNTPFSLHPHF